MTISLEEHVARAIWSEDEDEHDTCNRGKPDYSWEGWPQSGPEASRACVKSKDEYFALARAAIAAVREHAPDPAEAMRAECEAKLDALRLELPANAYERGRNAGLELAIAALKGKGEGAATHSKKEYVRESEWVELTRSERRQFAVDFVHEGQRPPAPAEAMRARTIDECEAIVRAGTPVMNPHSQFVCRTLADRIAALKGKGEG